ncbi:MAG: imidazole glycerol phosphate synthase subunit HisH [Anaerolineales bacterium]|nr:imidazole glycerol phosphate synthase subunit HisH [Anaerolineales bacterium]
MIVIVDYGMGNLGSILNMLKKIGVTGAKISSSPDEVEQADKLILPGVGAFDTGMKRLAETGLLEVLNEKVLKSKTPTLGVCLGMQLITKSSEEGQLPGLGWIDARTIRFQFDPRQTGLKIPHMGWNFIEFQREGALLMDMYPGSRFYFVHSYHVVCGNAADVLATTNYGYDFVSIVQHENIMGVQFHPEKSHKFGMRIYKNFVENT